MRKLDKLITKYADAEELKQILHSSGIDVILERLLEKIEFIPEQRFHAGITPLAGTILTSINEKLRLVGNPEEKRKLEYLLADIFQGFIENVISNSEDPHRTIDEIYLSLQSTCDINGYDFDVLATIVGLNKHRHVIKKPHKPNERYYLWNAEENELRELAKDLKSKKWVSSASDFSKLCSGDLRLTEIVISEKAIYHFIVMFDLLYTNGIISVKGGKGHFSPLVQRAIRDNRKYLYEKNVNKIHERLKRNAKVYKKVFNEIDKILRINIGKYKR